MLSRSVKWVLIKLPFCGNQHICDCSIRDFVNVEITSCYTRNNALDDMA